MLIKANNFQSYGNKISKKLVFRKWIKKTKIKQKIQPYP